MPSGKPKILIIEDESALIYALRAKFSASGFEATIALNGELALEFAEKEKFDIILLDLLLPKLNGFGSVDALSGKLQDLQDAGDRIFKS